MSTAKRKRKEQGRERARKKRRTKSSNSSDSSSSESSSSESPDQESESAKEPRSEPEIDHSDHANRDVEDDGDSSYHPELSQEEPARTKTCAIEKKKTRKMVKRKKKPKKQAKKEKTTQRPTKKKQTPTAPEQIVIPDLSDKRIPKLYTWDPAINERLRKKLPDQYWHKPNQKVPTITAINSKNPLELHTSLLHPGRVHAIQWSTDGQLLASCSSKGTIRIWDVDTWRLLQELKDNEEVMLEEFYALRFTPDNKKIFAAGKLMDKTKWSEEDDDYEITPGPIKLFDIMTGEVLGRFAGHIEEILCIKLVIFKTENYLLTASQDGYIIKWKFDKTWEKCAFLKRIDQKTTNIATSVAFLPDCGNKYFMSAADDGAKIYDFELGILLQQFPDLYTSYCDCIKFVKCTDLESQPGEYYVITRGVELVQENKPLAPNKCRLHKLKLPVDKVSFAPNSDQVVFEFNTTAEFTHPAYFSNSWPIKITSNGRYILAPTSSGSVFIWNMRSTELVAVLADHADNEVRDALFHLTKPFLLSCCDDSSIKVYTQTQALSPKKITPPPTSSEEKLEISRLPMKKRPKKSQESGINPQILESQIHQITQELTDFNDLAHTQIKEKSAFLQQQQQKLADVKLKVARLEKELSRLALETSPFRQK